MNPYKIVEEFENAVAEYCGSKYAIAVNSCTNALLLVLSLHRHVMGWDKEYIEIPKRTYVGVAYSVINAGYTCCFRDEQWEGEYGLEPFNIYDAARRFHKDMYHGGYQCLSFHWSKHLPIGRGGMILTDDEESAIALRKMRFDGRTEGIPPAVDMFVFPGYHCYMIPEDAARGLMLLASHKDSEDLPWDDYPDLSKHPIFKGGSYANHIRC